MSKIVTIQDISCYGQCSITVALPILSAYGIETAILPSAILSTHTGGFKDFTCLDLTAEMPSIVDHWDKEGIKYDAIYTGYIGDTRQFETIRSTRRLLNDEGLLIVDPAMADHGKLYVALNDDIVEGMRTIVREADVILPNLTEAAFLLGQEYQETYSKDYILELLNKLAAMGPRLVILTGVSYEEGRIGAVAYNKETGEITEYFTEKIERSYHGTGDVFSSIAIAEILNKKDIYEILKSACDFVVKCIRKTLPDESHGYGVKFERVLAEKIIG
ncbi:MAG: pyridoxamine kinase [Eubacterium sp.]|nr:pyridoxamine kinase [Eubacterium sp.]